MSTPIPQPAPAAAAAAIDSTRALYTRTTSHHTPLLTPITITEDEDHMKLILGLPPIGKPFSITAWKKRGREYPKATKDLTFGKCYYPHHNGLEDE